MNLRESVLADFGAKFWRDLRGRYTAAVATFGELREVGVESVCGSHGVDMDSMKGGRAQRYGVRNCGAEWEKGDFKFQI